MPSSPLPSSRPVESRDPATGEVWRRFEAASVDEVAGAVAEARRAQRAWAATPVRQRARVLERFRRALFRRRGEAAALITRENGKAPESALSGEVLATLEFARFYAREAPARLAPPRWFTPRSLVMVRKRVRIEHEPFGVIGIISPWNYPLLLAAGGVLPALVAGNAVVLKPSEFTPSSGALLAELFEEAGLPDGLLHVVHGDGRVGAALIAHGVDKVVFTGSGATGKKVAVACAERMIPCTLELGGSDPAIVLDDADPRLSAAGIVWGRFSNAGQTCTAPKRVYAVGAVYEPLLRELATAVSRLRVGAGGSGAEVGPLIRPSQAAELAAQLGDALARGARVVATAPVPASSPDVAYAAPTLLADVPPDARVLHEETFGPVLPVVRVRDVDEAVRLANASEFGLSASVWSASRARALEVARRVEAGSVAINDTAVVAAMADVPHGGVKGSGTGRAHGVAGLMECVRTRTVVADRLPGQPQSWWFGAPGGGYARLDGAVEAVHGRGVGGRLRGALRAAGLAKTRAAALEPGPVKPA
jgi:succinate-semialdehyde dehydrogenase/glutarate-semialdehyde dehydrogenase